MKHKFMFLFSAFMLFFQAFAQVDSEYDDNLPLNKIQVLGSHNSYRKSTNPKIRNWVKVFGGSYKKDGLTAAEQWEYNHIPLDSQLQNCGIRQIEIDIYNDPAGGTFYNRQGNVLVGESRKSNVDALLWGGMKVLHVPDFDYNTNYFTFKDALRAVKNWSVSNQSHVPVFIYVELKSDKITAIPGFAKIKSFDEKAMNDVCDEIYSVFDTSEILKPDDVRGNFATLREALITQGFPKLKDVRGKVVFILLAQPEIKKHITAQYPSYRTLPYFMFDDKISDNPEAAFLLIDNPKDTAIKTAVDKGFIVRTRADADTKEARKNDYSSFEAAKKQGAQLISTDFYLPFKKTRYVITKEMLQK